MIINEEFQASNKNTDTEKADSPKFFEDYGKLQLRRIVKEKIAPLLEINCVKISETEYKFHSKFIFLREAQCKELKQLLLKLKEFDSTNIVPEIIKLLNV